ncbi:MAG: hypothetical protein NT135_02430 [Candidatus Berkelbacteria bacterium]|nr:hypothetical protein [Candidatus Berkelbacteria bacterium]
MKKVVKKTKSSALLIAILIISLISAVTLSVSRLAISEIKMSAGASESSVSYFAAEAGLESGLARWRWDNYIEMPSGATETSKNINRYDLTPYVGQNPIKWENIDPTTGFGSDKKDHIYNQLKIWYKAPFVGEDKVSSGTIDASDLNDASYGKDGSGSYAQHYLIKDQRSVEFDAGTSGSVTLYWKWTQGIPGSTPGLGLEVEVRGLAGGVETIQTNIYGNPLDIVGAVSPDGPSGNVYWKQISFTGLTNPKLYFRPWQGNIVYGIQPTDPTKKIGTEKTYIESTGIYGYTKRKLLAEIDRSSGQIINIYDFVLYGGVCIRGSTPCP